MRVEPLIPDVAPTPAAAVPRFGALLDGVSASLEQADASERAFVAHRGGMLEMVVERARADIALQIAAAGAQRAAQSVQTLLGLQI